MKGSKTMTDGKRVSPTSDLAVKKILCSEEHKDVLKGFISDFFELRFNVEDIFLENPYSIKSYKEAGAIDTDSDNVLRATYKDVRARLKTEDFIAEVQVHKESFYSERSIYYPCDCFCSNYNDQRDMVCDSEGRPIRYSSLRPVYSMNILGYKHFTEDDDALRIFTLYDNVRMKRLHKDYINIGYFELVKENIETVNQQHWRDYFLTGSAADDAPDYIRKASSVIEYSNLSEEERDMLDARERAENIYIAERHAAYCDGVEEGREEGEKIGENNRSLIIARRLKQKGMDFSDISEATDLTVEAIERIK
jgi:predicted transposase/invertase (TIGR01784 family)